MKRLFAVVLLLALLLSLTACERSAAVTGSPDPSALPVTQEMSEAPTTETGIPDDFSFSLIYGILGDLTYDSETGVLVKQRSATHVEDYTTTYFCTDEQRYRLYDLIVEMDPSSYPDEYNPIADNISSSPSYEIVLTVTYHGTTKTITCHDVAIGTPGKDEQGERLLAVVEAIAEILYASDEWQALPEYEHFYA